MLRGVPDSVCKLFAWASSSSHTSTVNLSRRYSIFVGHGTCSRTTRECPQSWSPRNQCLSINSWCRGARPVPGDSMARASSFVLVLRRFGHVTQRRKGKMDSYSAAHVAADGREFRYATVVVPEMKEGDSALQAWTYACSLIGDSRCPTLAVAFVSKATKSAKKAVKEISQFLVTNSSGSNAQGQGSSSCGDVQAGERTNLMVQSRTEESTGAEQLSGKPRGVRIASMHTDLSKGLGADVNGPTGDDSAKVRPGNIPLIGCVASEWAEEFGRNWRLVGTVAASGSELSSAKKVSAANKRLFKKFDLGDGGKGILCDLQTAKDLFGDLSGDRERFLAVAAEVMDSDDDDGSLSDWEHLSAEAVQLGKGDKGIQVDGAIMRSEDLVVDMNVFKRLNSEGSSGSATTAADGSLELRTQDEEPCELATDHASAGTWSESIDNHNVVSSEGLESSAIEGKGRKYVVSSNVQAAGKNEDEDDDADDKYQLMICVGHFPGAKAVSFHSSSTGLPSLPNLEDAVLVNNPHMLLLGAPGFKFPDFLQRLSSVFPNSSRAGAFLSPLYSSIRGQVTRFAEKKAGPIFHGGDVETKGVTGLAISSAGTSDVPIEAFGEFVRMSLGMPRIRGFTFLDNSISKKLFFPSNVSVEHLTPGQRETSHDPRNVLEYLNQHIMRNSAGKVVPPESLASQSDASLKSMTKDLDRLPLALFDAVIFPGWSMPIHIYEPRYRIMVKQCVEEGKPFGLSSSLTTVHSKAVDSEEIIGTIVNLRVYLFEKDCRSYIIASGVQRFRVLDSVSYRPGSFGLAQGQVRIFDDTIVECAKERREVADLAREAVALCHRIMPEMREVPGLESSSSDPKLASFALGHLLPVPNVVKTRWLGMEDTKARLLEQMTFLETKARK